MHDIEFQHGDDRQIVLTLGNGLSLTLKDDDPVVDLDVDGGKAKLTIARDGTVTVKGQGDVTMEAGGDMTIKAGGTMTIQGAKVNIN